LFIEKGNIFITFGRCTVLYNPFAGRIACGKCGGVYGRKV